MSNYKHPTSKSIAEDIFGKYKITGENGEDLGTMCDKVIEDPRFGWEKVEEPFKEGEWCLVNAGSVEFLFRYGRTDQVQVYDNGEFYALKEDEILPDNHYRATAVCEIRVLKRATHEQVERILSVVARHKGYKEGVSFLSMGTDIDLRLKEGDFEYKKQNDCLYFGHYLIYREGTWAEIVEEPKVSEPEVEAGYMCIKTMVIKLDEIAFKKGKIYVFDKSGVYWQAIGENGDSHFLSPEGMHEWFDMSQDWKKKPVFSYEEFEEDSKDLSTSITRSLKIAGEEFLLIPCKWLEEEAKKRTNVKMFFPIPDAFEPKENDLSEDEILP